MYKLYCFSIYFLHISLFLHTLFICAATIFRLGELKLVKNNQDNQIQSITLCKMYFLKKGIRSVQWGLGESPRSWKIFQNFWVKINLRLLL